MKGIRAWVVAIFGGIGLIAAGFSFYSNFLLDYSLENLEIALQATDQKAENLSPLYESVYSAVAQDLAFEEASKTESNLQSLLLLERASQSFEGAIDRGGSQRANFYLTEVAKKQSAKRSRPLQALDWAYKRWKQLFSFIRSFVGYVHDRISPPKQKEEKPLEYSAMLLLNQAEQSEKNGMLVEAANLYRKFLAGNFDKRDQGLVSISLARLLIKQKKWTEAEKILRDIQQRFPGSAEWNLAAALLKKVNLIRVRDKTIGKLQSLIASHQGSPRADAYQFEMALAYLSSNQIAPALEVLKKIENTGYPGLRPKTMFYLGWLYKLNRQYDESEKAFQTLSKDPAAKGELGAAIKAQLADLYYQKKDMKKSMAQYQELAKGSDEEGSEVWGALAELEQANIYYFDMNLSKEAEEKMSRLQSRNAFSQSFNTSGLKREINQAYRGSLRDRAFIEMQKGKTRSALDLFERDLTSAPKDVWTHAGLATANTLVGDLQQAQMFADQAYLLKADEYTASVRGYVYALLDRPNEAISMYQEAAGFNPSYFPAQFNLSCVYLQLGRYQDALNLLTDLDRRIRKSSSVVRAKILNNMGYAFWGMGQREKAVEKFKLALELAPGLQTIKKNIARLEESIAAMPEIKNNKT